MGGSSSIQSKPIKNETINGFLVNCPTGNPPSLQEQNQSYAATQEVSKFFQSDFKAYPSILYDIEIGSETFRAQQWLDKNSTLTCNRNVGIQHRVNGVIKKEFIGTDRHDYGVAQYSAIQQATEWMKLQGIGRKA